MKANISSIHMSLAAAAQNGRLLRIIGDYHSFFEYQGFVAKRLLDRDFMDRTMQDHRMIVDALRRRCGEEAAQLISEHIAGAKHLIKLLREGLVSMDEDGEPAAKDLESELDGAWLRDPTHIVA